MKIENEISANLALGVTVFVSYPGHFDTLFLIKVRINNIHELFPWTIFVRNMVEEQEVLVEIVAIKYNLNREE